MPMSYYKVSVYVCMCVCVYVYICVYVYVCVCVCVCVCMCVYVCMYVCMCVCRIGQPHPDSMVYVCMYVHMCVCRIGQPHPDSMVYMGHFQKSAKFDTNIFSKMILFKTHFLFYCCDYHMLRHYPLKLSLLLTNNTDRKKI